MPLYTTAKKVVQRFVDHGYVALFAGGWVRDFIMKHPSDDIDIVTNAPLEVTQKIFPKTIPVGINFGIVIVVEDEHQFEVATFRKESEYVDGRRPTVVESATPEEDALRRDFTINGMFYDPLKEKLFDFVGGQQGIKNEWIQAIGNPHHRFLEDRLRMIRASRYAARFQFVIEPETRKAILYHASELFPAVAMERVAQEFKKMSSFNHFDQALLFLHDLTLLQVIFPTLKDLSHEELQERIQKIPHFPKEAPFIAKLYELFPSSSLDERLALCDYLKLSNKEREFTEELDTWRYGENLDDVAWARLYAKPTSHTCEEITKLHIHDSAFQATHQKRRKKLAPAILRIQQNTPIITASHLLPLGIPPGPQMGHLIKEGERLAILYSLTTPQEVLSHLFPANSGLC
jgi:poly(A) polymerase